MNMIKTGHWEADGGIVNIPIGFIPNYFMMASMIATPVFYHWWRRQESEEASGQQEGIVEAQTTHTLAADDAGIIAYNTGSQTPAIGIWEASSATVDERDGTSITIAARTATAPGTYINPTTSSTMDRDAIFECIATTGNTGATEPTWPAVIGEDVVDGSVTWRRVDVSTQRGGYQGVVIQDNIQTDGEEMYYVALLSDQDVDHGDTDGWSSGIDPDA